MALLTFTGRAQQTAEEWFEQANAAYNGGYYDSAVVLYEKIIATEMESVPVYYNMGNAYYKMHEYPMAIYCYEKALKLDPSNDDVKTNLAIANLAIVDKIEPMPQSFFVRIWRNTRAWLSGDLWAWCSVAAFALLLVALFLFLRARRIGLRKLGFFSGILFLVVFALSVVFAFQLKSASEVQDQAIIMAPTRVLRTHRASICSFCTKALKWHFWRPQTAGIRSESPTAVSVGLKRTRCFHSDRFKG